MRRELHRLATALLLIPLAGCVSTAVSIVTLPVRVAAKTVDVLTTSQSEADRNRGRRERKAEERDAKARHKAEVEAAREARRRR